MMMIVANAIRMADHLKQRLNVRDVLCLWFSDRKPSLYLSYTFIASVRMHSYACAPLRPQYVAVLAIAHVVSKVANAIDDGLLNPQTPMATQPTDLPIHQSLMRDTQALAKELNVSWSRLIALALHDFVQRHRSRKHLIEEINAAYADDPCPEEARLQRQMLSSQRRLVEGE